MRRSTLLLSVLAASATACSPVDAGDEVATADAPLTETSGPRAGSSIQSPSVSANKTYWGSRNIEILRGVRALNSVELGVALRADGILVNAPPNGRIGVDELAVLESRSATLFPAEKAAIAKLWSILEQTSAPKTTVPSPTIASTTVSTYATQPFKLPISALDPAQRNVAMRIELTHNDDANDQTISGADLANAWADRGSYLPAEANQFVFMAYKIAEKAPPLANDLQHVDVQTPALQTSVVASFGGVDLVAKTAVTIAGKYEVSTSSVTSRDLPRLLATTTVAATPSAGTDTRYALVHLDLATGADTADALGVEPGRTEIWVGGARVGELDLEIGAAASQPLPIGYAVTLDGVKHEWGCNPHTGICGFDAPMSGPLVYARSYMVAGAPGTTVDLFPSGRAVINFNGAAYYCYPASWTGAGSTTTIETCKVWAGQRDAGLNVRLGGIGAPGLGQLTTPDRRDYMLFPL